MRRVVSDGSTFDSPEPAQTLIENTAPVKATCVYSAAPRFGIIGRSRA
jgi:hypothetical protein